MVSKGGSCLFKIRFSLQPPILKTGSGVLTNEADAIHKRKQDMAKQLEVLRPFSPETEKKAGRSQSIHGLSPTPSSPTSASLSPQTQPMVCKKKNKRLFISSESFFFLESEVGNWKLQAQICVASQVAGKFEGSARDQTGQCGRGAIVIICFICLCDFSR